MYSGGEGAARESFIIEHQQRGDPKEFSKKKISKERSPLTGPETYRGELLPVQGCALD